MKVPESPFYLTVNHQRKDTGKCCTNAPLGKNTIGQHMKTTCAAAGIVVAKPITLSERHVSNVL